jgi:hypothetical protein
MTKPAKYHVLSINIAMRKIKQLLQRKAISTESQRSSFSKSQLTVNEQSMQKAMDL